MAIDDIARYRDILNEAAHNFDPARIGQYIKPSNVLSEVLLEIPVNKQFDDEVYITSVTTQVELTPEDRDAYYDGDIGVNYTVKDQSRMEDIMDDFYWNDSFSEELSKILLAAGFSESAALMVTTSEAGMQDHGRISYHGYLGDEVRATLGKLSTQQIMPIGLQLLSLIGMNLAASNIDDQKPAVMTDLLTAIKAAGSVQTAVNLMIRTLVASGVKWPELRALARSGSIKLDD